MTIPMIPIRSSLGQANPVIRPSQGKATGNRRELRIRPNMNDFANGHAEGSRANTPRRQTGCFHSIVEQHPGQQVAPELGITAQVTQVFRISHQAGSNGPPASAAPPRGPGSR